MWINIEWRGADMGVAQVVKPCCEALRSITGESYRDPYYEFNVEARENGTIYAFFHVDLEDGNGFPLKYCPSCGAPVSVMQQTRQEPRPLGHITSGKIWEN